ncbi:MAG: right-handed parallel beta-helix repeat-containing protein [Desulfobacterales bacterium]|nr:right-handed parallel beta-helix repeat-containing protein [Desulfobacterales bacterium]
MNRSAHASLAAVALLAASPAHAVTNQDGQVLITQAAVNAGNITPGDTPGFPVTISIGGSYRLGSNLTVTSAANGIEVKANDVTIDMGGFTLAGSGVGRNGITSFNRNTRLRDGSVRGFTLDGVRTIGQLLAVEHMVIAANGRYGVYTDDTNVNASSYASIANSKVITNGLDGVLCARHCRVENSLVSKNVGNGIVFADSGALALGNTVTENGQNGIYFYSFGGGAGNNVVMQNALGQMTGTVRQMQPNACSPACPPL